MTPIAPAPEWILNGVLARVTHEPYVEPASAEPARPAIALVRDDHDAEADAQTKYVRKGFQNELDYLGSSAPGTQSNDLNKAAFKIGTLVGTGLLSREEAEAELLNIARGFQNQPDREPWNEKTALTQIRSGLNAGTKKPRTIPTPSYTPKVVFRGREAREHIAGAEIEEDEDDRENIDPNDWRTGPYGVADGRILYIIEKTVKEETVQSHLVVCDLTARVKREITLENGAKAFLIQGRNVYGREFEFEITAEKFTDEKQLKAALVGAAGTKSTVRAGMAKHLYPAIDLLSGRVEHAQRFNRAGWEETAEGWRFLMPGREDKFPPHTSITLQGKLKYGIWPDAELVKGLECLENLIQAQSSSLGAVAIAAALQAPMAMFCHWRNERYCVFITGRTNSFKTSWVQVLMCIWGGDFLKDEFVVRWDGTVNAIMHMAVSACDMPLLIDNYKPNVGRDAAAKCIGMIQSIVEGGEKDRLTRAIELRSNSPIYAWPFITGEDVPDTDAASLARVLVLRFPQFDPVNDRLTRAQALSPHLCAVGNALLSWLETEDGRTIAQNIGGRFLDRRGAWATTLRGIRRDMQGVPRVATNLATNELAWEILEACPALSDFALKWGKEHRAGLQSIARAMADQTAESLEAHRYLEALRQLLSTGRYVLVGRHLDMPVGNEDKVVGWTDDEGIYLLPDLAYHAVEGLLRNAGGMNSLSKSTLHRQLDSIGALASRGKSELTVTKYCSARNQRVLHLKSEALRIEDDE